MKKTANYILVGLVILALLGVGYFGYTLYPKWNNYPQITSDTVYLKDTIPHIIWDTVPWYSLVLDTIIYTDTNFVNIDTGVVLKDYFAWHSYTRNWEDSLLSVTLHDVVSRNKFGGNEFTYKILRPQQIITNVTNKYFYSRYLLIGAELPLSEAKHLNLNIELTYVTNKWYGGVGYNSVLNSPTIKGGVTIKKWN